MTLLALIPNLDSSISWWTTVEAARYFWLAFVVVAVVVGVALARRNSGRVNSNRR